MVEVNGGKGWKQIHTVILKTGIVEILDYIINSKFMLEKYSTALKVQVYIQTTKLGFGVSVCRARIL